jgi:hypothetical protein
MSVYHPRRAKRTFTRGEIVRWNPPENAYSPRSEQSRLAGQSAMVLDITGTFAFVTFGKGRATLVCSDYLEKTYD